MHLVKKHKEKLDWELISLNKAVTWDIVKKHLELVSSVEIIERDWEGLSLNPNLTPEFIDKLNLEYLSRNTAVTVDLIRKHPDWEYYDQTNTEEFG